MAVPLSLPSTSAPALRSSSSTWQLGSTSLTIIQQSAAAVGVATMPVILSHEITDRPAPAAATSSGVAPVPELLPASLADSYASTFGWALVVLLLALVAALFLPREKAAAPKPTTS